MNNLILLLFGLSYFTLSYGLVPDYIIPCKRDDPDINSCISNSVEALRPKLRDGIPELNVPSMEPLPINTITLTRGPQNARVDLNITHLKVRGPSNFIVKSLDCDIPNNRFAFRVLLPKLHFKGHYAINMKILLLKVKGQGPITGNITNMFLETVMQGHKTERDGAGYMRFERLNIKLTVGEAKIKLDNLFNGDTTLGNLANDVINDNSELFVEEIRPALEKSMSDVFTDVANNIVERFTYEELFPL